MLSLIAPIAINSIINTEQVGDNMRLLLVQ